MKILVTGATGFVGNVLLDELPKSFPGDPNIQTPHNQLYDRIYKKNRKEFNHEYRSFEKMIEDSCRYYEDNFLD